ncbi:uncharacterized protein [Bemisia tabaci]|uniref:uncharacterized protein isoform X2 n=1 Tax=Bemisia tabaci TaxID=7038 RepID=UPI003B28A385
MQITMSQSLLFLVIIVVATVSILDAVPVSQSQISSVSESHQNTLSDALSDQDVLTPLKSSDEGKALVREKRTIGFLRTLFPGLSQPSETENQVAESKTSEVKVRKTRQTSDDSKTGESSSAATDTDKDLDTNETSSNDDTNADVDDNEEAPTEDDGRNKRFLFNLGGGGGSGGGSGNFLFDIIRLVAGSGTTQDKDEQENAPLDSGSAAQSVPKEDGYSAGVPGPLTRLFVIANRGIANLIQDLILRLAQTSERIVNFKARLITSII